MSCLEKNNSCTAIQLDKATEKQPALMECNLNVSNIMG